MSTPDIETAEMLSRKAKIGTREVDLRRDLGIVIGDGLILALVVDIYHGKIPGKDGYLWKVVEPIIEKYKDVLDDLNPDIKKVYSDKTLLDQTTAQILAQQERRLDVPQG
tara:strand:+ start:280 stop:609 length:330 start_codon:yes stop_codon:yes gene_type:complete